VDEATGPVEAFPVSPPTLVAVVADVPEPGGSDEVQASIEPLAAEAESPVAQGPSDHAPVALDGLPGPLNGDAGPAGCTPAQMRRFIKSRPWIPMHELRRRFGINGHEDDVTGVFVGSRTVFVGLPEREGRMLGELLRGGDVGYELSVDPVTPIVIGVFPMRPVARS
jgi:hypothetical protein